MWKSLSDELTREAQYCTAKSALYHDLLSELLAWTEAIRRGESDALHVGQFKSALERRWAGREFQSWFERPLLLVAALHRLVRAGQAPRLAPFYATIGGSYHRDRDRAALGAALADLLAATPEVFAATLAAQRLQTNETSRGVAWLVPYAVLNARLRRPAIVIELGCSGGLNLLADRYGWEFAIEGASAPPPSARPVFRQALMSTFNTGLRSRLDALPETSRLIARRLGCDLAVPDLTTEDDLAALSACVWGDDRERLDRLREAAEQLIAHRRAGSIELSQADMLDYVETHVRAQIGAAPPSLVVVYNTVVTCYVSAEQYARLRAGVTALFAALPQHRCAWIEHEPLRAGEVAAAPDAESYIRLHTLQDGALRTAYLGTAEMHPKNIAWTTSLERLAVDAGLGI